MTGAARLAARAAQRMGAGLVTLVVPDEALLIYATALESVIVRGAAEGATWRAEVENPKRDVILIGPGLGLGVREREAVLTALATQKPCVLDADALTNFAYDPETLLHNLHSACVLTPHEGEFERVFGRSSEPKISRAQKAAQRAGCVVLLKGAETVIAAPDEEPLVNTNAPPWLATAGAGDVLAGMIVGLLAQHMSCLKAAAAAAWIHGECANHLGLGLIAEDVVGEIPVVLQELQK